jgi:hypothetical protein
MTETFVPGFGLRFADLYARDGLMRLDGIFLDDLRERFPDLHGRLLAARAASRAAARKAESELLVELAPVVENFLARLFGIEAEDRATRSRRSIRSSACSFSAARRRR